MQRSLVTAPGQLAPAGLKSDSDLLAQQLLVPTQERWLSVLIAAGNLGYDVGPVISQPIVVTGFWASVLTADGSVLNSGSGFDLRLSPINANSAAAWAAGDEVLGGSSLTQSMVPGVGMVYRSRGSHWHELWLPITTHGRFPVLLVANFGAVTLDCQVGLVYRALTDPLVRLYGG